MSRKWVVSGSLKGESFSGSNVQSLTLHEVSTRCQDWPVATQQGAVFPLSSGTKGTLLFMNCLPFWGRPDLDLPVQSHTHGSGPWEVCR